MSEMGQTSVSSHVLGSEKQFAQLNPFHLNKKRNGANQNNQLITHPQIRGIPRQFASLPLWTSRGQIVPGIGIKSSRFAVHADVPEGCSYYAFGIICSCTLCIEVGTVKFYKNWRPHLGDTEPFSLCCLVKQLPSLWYQKLSDLV